MKTETLQAITNAYDIEMECIREMKDYIDPEAFGKAVDLLATAPRIGTSGCGHSGIICQHFAHLMCCIERPARFVSPAEAVTREGAENLHDLLLIDDAAVGHAENIPEQRVLVFDL